METELEKIKTEIERRANDLGLTILPATSGSDSKLPLVEFSPTDASDPVEMQITQFMDLVAKLKPGILFLECGRLTEAAVEDALEQISDAESADDEDASVSVDEFKRLRKRTEECRSHIGKIDLLSFRIPVPNTSQYYGASFYRDWNDLIYDMESFLEGESEIDPPSLSKAQRKSLVEKIAKEKGFLDVKNNGDIDLIMAEVLDEHKIQLPEYDWQEIRSAAKSHFNMKVRPELHKTIVKRARALLAAGKNRIEASEEIGVSMNVLAKLLRGR